MTCIEFDHAAHTPQNSSATGNLIASLAIILVIWSVGTFVTGPVEFAPDFHGNSGSLAIVK